MFTKYFGLFLIVSGIAWAFYSLLFNGVLMRCVAESTRILSIPCFNGGSSPIRIYGYDLFFGILISIAIVLVTFLVGGYLYKSGKFESTSTNLKMNKFVKIATILLVASILVIPSASSLERMSCGNEHCDPTGLSLGILILGVLPAMIMSGIAIILLIIHWLKNRGLR